MLGRFEPMEEAATRGARVEAGGAGEGRQARAEKRKRRVGASPAPVGDGARRGDLGAFRLYGSK